jgi:hypothetical protein
MTDSPYAACERMFREYAEADYTAGPARVRTGCAVSRGWCL